MATISYLIDRNASMQVSGNAAGITETDGSGVTMAQGIELNIDKAKVTSKCEIIEALDMLKKAISESQILA